MTLLTWLAVIIVALYSLYLVMLELSAGRRK